MQPSKMAVFLPLFMAAALAAQTAPKLTSADFVLTGIPDRADTGVVRRVLGSPDSIADGDDPSQAGPIPTWWYRDLRVAFLAGHELHGWWLTGRSRSTQRGLRVGAARVEIQRLYGSPTNAYGDSVLVYCEPYGGTVPRCMYVSVRRDHVQGIYVGRNID